MNRKIGLLLIFLILFNLVFISVQAAERENVLDPLFEAFGGINIGATYERHWQFIDAFLYFVIFIGTAHMTLSKKFPGRGGKAVIVAIGVALAFAMSYWAINNDFSFRRFGPIAGFILLLVVAFLLFKLVRGDREEVGAPFLVSIAVVYLLLVGFFPEIFESLKKFPGGRLIVAIINILAIIGIFWGIPHFVIGRVTRGFEGGVGDEDWRGIAGPPGRGPTRRARRRAERREREEEGEERGTERLEAARARLDALEDAIRERVTRARRGTIAGLEEIYDLLGELEGVIEDIESVRRR